METIKVMVDFCTSIMNYEINLFGYHVSLTSVMVYGMVGVLVVRFFYGVFK